MEENNPLMIDKEDLNEMLKQLNEDGASMFEQIKFALGVGMTLPSMYLKSKIEKFKKWVSKKQILKTKKEQTS